jgi:YD repeat-containing protein
MQIHGKVKKIDYFNVQYDEQKGWINRRPWISEFYNQNGNITERSVFHDNQMSSRVVTHYDAKGRKISDDSYSAFIDKTMTIPLRTELILDNAGRVLETKVFSRNGDKIDVFHNFKYDERGNQIERNYGTGGRVLAVYDAHNNETSTISYSGTGVVTGRTFSEHDNRRRRVKLVIHTDGMFRKEAVLRFEIRFKYDAKSRIIEKQTFEFNAEPNVTLSHAPEPGKILYIYDDDKKTMETVKYTSEGYVKEKLVTIFDDRGKESGFNCESADFETCKQILKYQYDAQGNWIRKTRSGRRFFGDDLRPYQAEERVISYY